MLGELMSWGRLVCLIGVNSFPFVLFYDFMVIPVKSIVCKIYSL